MGRQVRAAVPLVALGQRRLSTTAAPRTRASTPKIIRFHPQRREGRLEQRRSSASPPSVRRSSWTGGNDWNDFYASIWQRDAAAKYLQHQKITRWDGATSRFTGGLHGTVENGTRTFYDHGRKVLDGDRYLLPWDQGRKLYTLQQVGRHDRLGPRPAARTRLPASPTTAA
ncbi:glycoside hydrolase family 101 beta sandwich domain-containing protein [Streptomyces sp. KL116D]|uniref:glycoside hydrolase family 101 beta sandwich domain-containing protein n=1 Tax=Streptomyces sp. KL116D TaxID=3045152 RepID=UPI003558D898